MTMTNAQAAAHFASLPPNNPAMVLVINGDTAVAESFALDAPGTNLEEIEDELLDQEDRNYPTIFQKW